MPPLPDVKRDRLDRVLADRGLAAVWLARPSSFAWLTGGDNVVDRAGAVGVAAAGYDGEAVRVVTDDIEADRLRAEELPDGVPVRAFPWHESSLAAAVATEAPTPAAADFDVPGFERLDPGRLYRPLTDAEVGRYRDLGRAVAAVVERVCRDADPGDTERAVAGRLRGGLAERGIDSPVVLVGGGDRAPAYRHYTPRDRRLGGYALVSVTAARDGLHASCTRAVAFDPPEWLSDRHAAAARVEATALAATRRVGRAGGTAGDAFGAVRRAYRAVGHPGEWHEHHQGGAAGYAGREWIATPGSGARVELPAAYAWNPTVAGAKSEDTVLVTAEGYETLTATGDWPTEPVEPVAAVDTVDPSPTFDRPRPLSRS